MRTQRRGGLLRPRTEHLLIGGRDKSALLAGVVAQAAAVREALVAADAAAVPVHPLLVFVDSDLPWLGPMTARDVTIASPRQAIKLINAAGWVARADRDRVARALDRALPPAR